MSTIIKGYELRDKIGEGGFGTVHRAYQSQINREVAIKAILPRHANEPDFIRRFENEAQLVARLEHFHIVPLYDYWRDPDGAYLVMRWMKGGNLAETIKLNGALDLSTASQIMHQLCTALAYAHQRGVIHRDLKPLNILLDEDGNAYVSDFGIAKDNSLPVSGVTEVDSILGSPEYIAPEQARGEQVTARTDIYGLGVILYEILAGEHPFPNLTPIEKMYKHLNSPLPLLTNLPTEVVDAVNMVIQKATAKNPAERFADALSLLEAYQNAVDTFAAPASLVQILTRRERDILRLLIQGKSNKDIAQNLVVELATVKWYNNQLYKKLNVRNRNDLISKGRELLTQLDSLVVDSGTAVENGNGADGTYLVMPDIENPYKGLRAFQIADAQDFFGREKIANKLITRLQEKSPLSRFLAVVGPSGSGKSSLVRAGLIPAVWRGAIQGSDKWFVADMLPGNRPLDELEIALIRVAGNSGVNIREQLERDQHGLLRATQLILPDDGSELLLIIDQFEEVFTLLEDETQRQHFLALLVAAVTDKRSRVRVVITLRADFYDRPLRYPEFGELIRDRVETILPLSAEELERAITKPAERVGIKFEDGLVASMVSAINYQPGALPLLQYALTELFDAREGRLITQSAYQHIGGVVGALAKSADSLYNEMSPDGQALTRQLFLRLVTLGEGTDDTRRRVARSELLAISPQTDAVEEILDIFANARLLSLDNDPTTRTPTVEVAHEAILREWERLRTWLAESREDIKQQRAVSQLAEAWQTNRRDKSYLVGGTRLDTFANWQDETQLVMTPLEKDFLQTSVSERERQAIEKTAQEQQKEALKHRAQKILQGLVAVFVVSTIVAVGLSIFAFGQRAKAQDAEASAKIERDNFQRKSNEFRSIAMAAGAQEERFNKRPQNALALALESIQMDESPLLAEQVFFDIATSSWIRQQYPQEVAVWDARFLFDNQRIVTTNWGNETIVWDLAGNQLNSTPGDFYIETHPSQPLVAVGAGSEGLLLWNVDTNEKKYLSLVEGKGTLPLAFNTDGSQLFAYTEANGQFAIIDIATQTVTQTVPAYEADAVVWSGDISPDGRYFVTSSLRSGTATVWDTTTWEELQTLTFQPDSFVWDAQFIPNSPYVIAGDGTYGTIRLWDWQANEIVWEATKFDAIQDIAVSPDGRYFVTGNNDPLTHMSLWEVATGDFVRRFDGHVSRIQNLDFSPDGQHIVTASLDGSAILWDVWGETEREVMPLASISFDADNDGIIAFTTDHQRFAYPNFQAGTVEIGDIASGEILQSIPVDYLEIPDFEYATLEFSLDQQLLLFVSGNQIVLIHLDTGEVQYLATVDTFAFLDSAISPDGSLIAVHQLAGRKVTLRHTATGEVVNTLRPPDMQVLGNLVFSPDGQLLYTSLGDGSLAEWDVVASGDKPKRLWAAPEDKYFTPLAIKADGTVLLMAVDDHTFVAWDIATEQVMRTFVGHTDSIVSLAFSPDELTVLSGSTDKTLILWDYETAEPLRRFVGHSTTPVGDFNTDGTRIVSMGDGGEIIIWDNSAAPVPLEEWVLDNRYIPPFTPEQCELYEIYSAKCPE